MRINLFGGPSCGKSTWGAAIYAALKKREYNVELVREYIKNWAYLKKQVQSFDQVYIFSKQLYAEDSFFQTGVEHIVTDCPLLLCCSYAQQNDDPGRKELLSIAQTFESKHSSINILIERDDALNYEGIGRYHDSSEAIEADRAIEDFISGQINYEKFKLTALNEAIKLIETKIQLEKPVVLS